MNKSLNGLVLATAGVIVAALGTVFQFMSTGMWNGAGIIVMVLSGILAVYNLVGCLGTKTGLAICERDTET